MSKNKITKIVYVISILSFLNSHQCPENYSPDLKMGIEYESTLFNMIKEKKEEESIGGGFHVKRLIGPKNGSENWIVENDSFMGKFEPKYTLNQYKIVNEYRKNNFDKTLIKDSSQVDLLNEDFKLVDENFPNLKYLLTKLNKADVFYNKNKKKKFKDKFSLKNSDDDSTIWSMEFHTNNGQTCENIDKMIDNSINILKDFFKIGVSSLKNGEIENSVSEIDSFSKNYNLLNNFILYSAFENQFKNLRTIKDSFENGVPEFKDFTDLIKEDFAIEKKMVLNELFNLDRLHLQITFQVPLRFFNNFVKMLVNNNVLKENRFVTQSRITYEDFGTHKHYFENNLCHEKYKTYPVLELFCSRLEAYPPVSKTVQGLFIIVNLYLSRYFIEKKLDGKSITSYPKTYTPIMSRNSIKDLYNNLNEQEKINFKQIYENYKIIKVQKVRVPKKVIINNEEVIKKFLEEQDVEQIYILKKYRNYENEIITNGRYPNPNSNIQSGENQKVENQIDINSTVWIDSIMDETLERDLLSPPPGTRLNYSMGSVPLVNNDECFQCIIVEVRQYTSSNVYFYNLKEFVSKQAGDFFRLNDEEEDMII